MIALYLRWQESAIELVSPNKGQPLFMAATTLVIRLCACVRYWAGQFSTFFFNFLKIQITTKGIFRSIIEEA